MFFFQFSIIFLNWVSSWHNFQFFHVPEFWEQHFQSLFSLSVFLSRIFHWHLRHWQFMPHFHSLEPLFYLLCTPQVLFHFASIILLLQIEFCSDIIWSSICMNLDYSTSFERESFYFVIKLLSSDILLKCS